MSQFDKRFTATPQERFQKDQEKIENKKKILEELRILVQEKGADFWLDTVTLDSLLAENNIELKKFSFSSTKAFISAFDGGLKEIRQKLGLRLYK